MRLAFALVLTAALTLGAPADAKKKVPRIKTADVAQANDLTGFLPPPLTPDNTWDLDLSDGGRVVIQLRPDQAPLMVERIKTLTHQGFYNGLLFHRVIEGFMAQAVIRRAPARAVRRCPTSRPSSTICRTCVARSRPRAPPTRTAPTASSTSCSSPT